MHSFDSVTLFLKKEKIWIGIAHMCCSQNCMPVFLFAIGTKLLIALDITQKSLVFCFFNFVIFVSVSQLFQNENLQSYMITKIPAILKSGLLKEV